MIHTPREHRIRRLISRAATTRLCRISAKGGPLSDWADEEICERTRARSQHDDTPRLEHPFMDHAISEALAVSLDNPWDKFLARVSELTGIENLDGCSIEGAPDYTGYSLDELFRWFRIDVKAEEAAHRINKRRSQ